MKRILELIHEILETTGVMAVLLDDSVNVLFGSHQQIGILDIKGSGTRNGCQIAVEF